MSKKLDRDALCAYVKERYFGHGVWGTLAYPESAPWQAAEPFDGNEPYGFMGLDMTLFGLWRVAEHVKRIIAPLRLHVIDHAWLIRDTSPERYIRGFVTEPYVIGVNLPKLDRELGEFFSEWGMFACAFDRDKSSWNPPQTAPLAFVVPLGRKAFFTAWIADFAAELESDERRAYGIPLDA